MENKIVTLVLITALLAPPVYAQGPSDAPPEGPVVPTFDGLNVDGDVDIDGNMDVSGNSTFVNATVNGVLTLANLTLNNITVNTLATIASLTVTGASSLRNTAITGTLSVSSTTNLNGWTYLGNSTTDRTYVSGTAYLNSNTFIGDSNSDKLTVEADADFNDDVEINSILDVNGRIFSDGITTPSGGSLLLDTNVVGDLTVWEGLYLLDDINLSAYDAKFGENYIRYNTYCVPEDSNLHTYGPVQCDNSDYLVGCSGRFMADRLRDAYHGAWPTSSGSCYAQAGNEAGDTRGSGCSNDENKLYIFAHCVDPQGAHTGFDLD